MKLIEQSYEIIYLPDNLIQMIEYVGRTCYQSHEKITDESAIKFVQMLRNNGHHAMIEFGDIIVKFITNRGVTHELVRHRLCSFAQESTRYVKYSGDMEFIKPVWFEHDVDKINLNPALILNDSEWIFYHSCFRAERDYKRLIDEGWKPQQAREILPNALKTEIIVKSSIREWRHILSLRCSTAAHPQMSSLMIPLKDELKQKIPVLFDDI